MTDENGSNYQLNRDWELLRTLVRDRSFAFGEFTLSSGKTSNYYFDAKQVTLDPSGAYLLSKIILQKIKGLDITAVGGPTIGADPIVGALAVAAFTEGLENLKFFIVRKEPKKHGKRRYIEGPELNAGERVAVVEDVITTGGSVLKAIDAVRSAGCDVVKVIALVDRKEGGAEKIASMGVEVDPVFTIDDFDVK
ncbi:MAG TPA: orotate phosphoribosyltransferase [Bacillota bacterium]|nr:orotate phosphoribosyltransferase [Bacillota bacterium]